MGPPLDLGVCIPTQLELLPGYTDDPPPPPPPGSFFLLPVHLRLAHSLASGQFHTGGVSAFFPEKRE